MMSETKRIRGQLKRSLDGDAWHGPALLELLKDVTAEQAASRPLAGAHSIWEIVLHVTVWIEQVRARLRGDDRRKDLPPREDWPPQPEQADNNIWQDLLTRLRNSHQAMTAELAALEESRLEQPILEGFSSTYMTLHGLVQHNLYHAGQIAILKKSR